MAILVGILSTLGLLIHVRIMIIWQERDTQLVTSLWQHGSVIQKVLLLAGFAMPFVYYGFCLASCFKTDNEKFMRKYGLLVHLLAAPSFVGCSFLYIALQQVSDLIQTRSAYGCVLDISFCREQEELDYYAINNGITRRCTRPPTASFVVPPLCAFGGG